MNYTGKIEAYTAGKMSDLEQLVFEQELAENDALKEAFDAHQLTEALLGFTANNLSEAAILGNAPVLVTNASVGTSKVKYYGAGLFALCFIGLFTFIYPYFTKTNSPTPTIETKQVMSAPAELTIPINQATKETIIFQDPTQEIQAKQKPVQKATPSKVSKPKVITKKPSNPKPIAAVQKKVQPARIPIKKAAPVLASNLSSNKQVNNGEAIVYKAGESITFEPGFVAEAGSSVFAGIEEKALDR